MAKKKNPLKNVSDNELLSELIVRLDSRVNDFRNEAEIANYEASDLEEATDKLREIEDSVG